jgi:hypothetical protein
LLFPLRAGVDAEIGTCPLKHQHEEKQQDLRQRPHARAALKVFSETKVTPPM